MLETRIYILTKSSISDIKMIIIISSFTSQISAKAKEPCGLLLWCHLGNLLAGSDHSERSVCNELELSLVQLWQLNNLLLHKYKSQHSLAPRPTYLDKITSKIRKNIAELTATHPGPNSSLCISHWPSGLAQAGSSSPVSPHFTGWLCFCWGPTKLKAELSRFLF